MDKQDVRILVRKFNTLFKSMEESEGQPSAVERDLMLSYVRQLYDYFLQEPEVAHKHKPEEQVVVVPSYPPPAPPVVVTPVPETPVRPIVAPAPPIVPIASPPLPPVVAPAPAPVVQAPPESMVPLDPNSGFSVEPPRQAEAERTYQNQGIDQLFSFKKATEWSERLGESPVSDLGRAMSINDRLLYMNELFGKDRGALEESIQVLNRFESFETARSFLYNLAEQYHWAAENRLEIAHAFIKLVRRRYL